MNDSRCLGCGKFHRPPTDCRPLNTATTARLKPTARLLLGLLRRAGSHGMLGPELANAGVGFRYSARAMELREAGFGIETERLTNTLHRFTLVSEPAVETAAVVHGTRAALPAGEPATAVVSTLGMSSVGRESSSEAGRGEDARVSPAGLAAPAERWTLFDHPPEHRGHYGRNAA